MTRENSHIKAAEAYLKRADKALWELHLINDHLEVYYDITPKPSEQLGFDCKPQEDNNGE